MTIIFRPSGGTGLYSIIYNIAQGTELGDSHKAVVSKSGHILQNQRDLEE